jgi:hypothetical protein
MSATGTPQTLETRIVRYRQTKAGLKEKTRINVEWMIRNLLKRWTLGTDAGEGRFACPRETCQPDDRQAVYGTSQRENKSISTKPRCNFGTKFAAAFLGKSQNNPTSNP